MAYISGRAGSLVRGILERNARGTVAGAFKNGCYLDFGGSLIVLCGRKYGEIPFGIGVEYDAEAFASGGAMPGADAQWRCGILKVATGGIEIEPSFPEAARREKPRLSASEGERLRKSVRAMLAGTDRGAVKDLPDGGTAAGRQGENVCLRGAKRGAAELYRALRSGDGRELGAALFGILGLGPGLTPSMDDWLCGFICCARRMIKNSRDAAILQSLCDNVKRLAAWRTTAVSAAYLNAAAEGWSFEIIEDTLDGRTDGGRCAVLEIGSNSGADILTGILCAAEFYGGGTPEMSGV